MCKGRKKSPELLEPISLILSSDILDILEESEYEYWQDCGSPMSGQKWMDDEGTYHTTDHIFIILSRYASVLEIRNIKELKTIWIALCKDSFKLDNNINILEENKYCFRAIKNIEKLLKPYITKYCPNMFINYSKFIGVENVVVGKSY